MNLFTTGRVCLKIAGRDAGRKAVVVEELDNTFVLVDGDVRRKKANVKHLEPLPQVLEIHSGASHEEVKKAFDKHKWPVWETKEKKVGEKPMQKRKSSAQKVTTPAGTVEKKQVKETKKAEVKKESKKKLVKS